MTDCPAPAPTLDDDFDPLDEAFDYLIDVLVRRGSFQFSHFYPEIGDREVESVALASPLGTARRVSVTYRDGETVVYDQAALVDAYGVRCPDQEIHFLAYDGGSTDEHGLPNYAEYGPDDMGGPMSESCLIRDEHGGLHEVRTRLTGDHGEITTLQVYHREGFRVPELVFSSDSVCIRIPYSREQLLDLRNKVDAFLAGDHDTATATNYTRVPVEYP